MICGAPVVSAEAANESKGILMKVSPILVLLLAPVCLSLSSCSRHAEQAHEEAHTIVATIPQVMPVTVTERYVCQIHSQRHIKVCVLEQGYLEAISVKEGQAVKEGDVLFKVRPVLYQAKFDSENAEAKVA